MTECYRLIQTEEFEDWLESEGPRSRYQIDDRLARLRLDGHFGSINNVSRKEPGVLKNKIWELKFNDGRPIYYSCFPELNILLILGGNKHGQNKDIEKAKKIFTAYTKVKKK